MSEFREVARLDDLAPGEVIAVEVDGVAIALARDTDGSIHALGNTCTHESVALSDGEVWESSLECWKHGSQFDLHTGQPRQRPASAPTPVYPVHIDTGTGVISVNASATLSS